MPGSPPFPLAEEASVSPRKTISLTALLSFLLLTLTSVILYIEPDRHGGASQRCDKSWGAIC